MNKGELLHVLCSWLWFGGDGSIRKKQEEGQQLTVQCLNILTNAVVVWNTVFYQAVLEKYKQEGLEIKEEDLEFLSPA